MLTVNRIRERMVESIYYVNNSKIYDNRSELERLINYDYCRLYEYKNNKFMDLLLYVTVNYPYYAEMLSRTKMIDGIKGLCDIRKLPILSKKFLKHRISSLTQNSLKHSWRSTSGTTGTPFTFPKDEFATGYMDAMMHSVYSWHGIKIGDKQARLWGRSLKKYEMVIQYLKDFLLNRKRLSAFEMSDYNCSKYYMELLNFKPKYFYAYSNALYQFAVFVEKNNLNGKLLEIDIAICTGEVLFPYQRERILAVFGCRVVNEYGSTENGIIGFECEYGTMHLMPTIFLEIDNPDENGFGEIVITELNSRSIPFIRYKNGDIGKVCNFTCECNRPYEIIEVKEGRIDDYIRCPDGRFVYDAVLAYTFKEYALQFKAYQEDIDFLKIYIVPNSCYNVGIAVKLIKNLQKYVGQEMRVEILEVKEIPFEKSGKFRYFVSRLGL